MQMREKRGAKRAVAAIVVVAGLTAVAVSMAGAAAGSRRTAQTFRVTGAPTWSPDGKQIAFAYNRSVPASVGDQAAGFRLVRTSSRPGRAIHTIRNQKNGWPWVDSMLWARGGRILINADASLYIVALHGGKPKPIVFPDCGENCYEAGFIFSPSRTVVAVSTCGCGDPHDPPGGIALVKLTGAEPQVLWQEGGDDPLAFSPGGGQLVFRRTGSSGPSALMAISLTGGTPMPLTQSGIPGASLVPNDVQQVQWSPNGRWLAFVENGSLEVVPTTGVTAPRTLATGCCGNAFAWSPTSRLISYNSDGRPLMTVRPDGTHLTNLLKGRRLTYDGGAQWSPGGSRLIFLAHGWTGHVWTPYDHVWTIRPNGRNLTRRG